MPADDVSEAIIHPHLVIEKIEAGGEIGRVKGGIIDLTDELQFRIESLHTRCGIAPELRRHHFRHVATESVYSL